MSQIKQFESIISGLAGKYRQWDIFRDFVEMSALALSQPLNFQKGREERYLEIAKRYSKDELIKISHLLSVVVEALEEKPQDFLGECYQQLGLSSKQNGQFFTPYYLCQMMAQMVASSEEVDALEVGKYITVNEPACGAGANIIALFEHYRKHKVDTNRKVFVVAQDIDRMCAHMCFVQFSLLDIPAQVIIGNTLTLEAIEHFNTPAAYLYGWNSRLRKEKPSQEVRPSINEIQSEAVPTVQLSMF